MPKHFHLTKIHHTMRRIGLIMRFLSAKKGLRVLLLLAVVGVGLSYLFTVISISTHGYNIRDLESRIDDLRIENKKLNLEVAKKKSLVRVEDWVKTSGMVAATDVQYASATTGMVAAR